MTKKNAMFSRAIVRTPGPDAGLGLTTAELGRPDFGRLLAQHAAYVETLRSLGLEVEALPSLPGFPDAYFIEDTAVVLPEIVVITRPGAPPRQGETASVEPALAENRPIARIVPPGTLDGGDVLLAGGRLFIGVSERTNAEGARQLGDIAASHGFPWTAVPVGRGLHLKSFVNTLGGRMLAVASGFEGAAVFGDYERVVLAPGDEYAANTLWVNGTLIMPAGFPAAKEKLSPLGLPIIELEMGEMRKMDGGLTCLSLRF